MQINSLYIHKYLQSLQIDVTPKHIITENYPNIITEFPSIQYNNKYYIGLDECIKFYEHITGIQYLHEKALQFKIDTPSFKLGKFTVYNQ
jgi:hypothetical protein